MSPRIACLIFLAGCSVDEGAPLDGGLPTDLGLPDAAVMDAEPGDGPSSDAGACSPPAATDPGVVRTAFATLRGTQSGTTWAYLGVPFAAPPIGELRFRRPTAPSCEPVVREASAFGSVCPQLDQNGAALGDEDCLTLNVWAPATPGPSPLPVLFFIHGGGQNQGSSSELNAGVRMYDGRQLAERGNVVVTINYRLGALGFMSHALLEAESGSAGNYGIADQIQALSWVKDNIGAFGGDPSRVLTFGESAGGVDVCLLYVSPRAEGLFQRALIQSGGCIAQPKATGVAAAGRLLDGLACATDPDPIACARSKTPAEILAALPPLMSGLSASDFQPTVDGDLILEAPALSLMAGRHADVPLALGTNEDETYRMLPPPSQIATTAAFEQAARMFLIGNGVPQAKHAAVIAVYPEADFGGDPHAALVALSTDFRWTCAGRAFLRALAASASAPLYRYFFTRGLDPTAAPMASRAGAFHGLELLYVFGGILDSPVYAATSDDNLLTEQVQRYWSRFAATDDPNGGTDPIWPAYDVATDPYLKIDVPSAPSAQLRMARCDALSAALQ